MGLSFELIITNFECSRLHIFCVAVISISRSRLRNSKLTASLMQLTALTL